MYDIVKQKIKIVNEKQLENIIMLWFMSRVHLCVYILLPSI